MSLPGSMATHDVTSHVLLTPRNSVIRRHRQEYNLRQEELPRTHTPELEMRTCARRAYVHRFLCSTVASWCQQMARIAAWCDMELEPSGGMVPQAAAVCKSAEPPAHGFLENVVALHCIWTILTFLVIRQHT